MVMVVMFCSSEVSVDSFAKGYCTGCANSELPGMDRILIVLIVMYNIIFRGCLSFSLEVRCL